MQITGPLTLYYTLVGTLFSTFYLYLFKLFPITNFVPKCLATVLSRLILEYPHCSQCSQADNKEIYHEAFH